MVLRLLHTALDTGAEAILYVRGVSDVYFRGQVQDLDEQFVALFLPSEDDEAEGMLWAFRHADIVGCGLVTRLPENVSVDSPLLHR